MSLQNYVIQFLARESVCGQGTLTLFMTEKHGLSAGKPEPLRTEVSDVRS